MGLFYFPVSAIHTTEQAHVLGVVRGMMNKKIGLPGYTGSPMAHTGQSPIGGMQETVASYPGSKRASQPLTWSRSCNSCRGLFLTPPNQLEPRALFSNAEGHKEREISAGFGQGVVWPAPLGHI